MATNAATLWRRPRAQALARPGLLVGLGLGALTAISLLVRTAELGAGLWVDEGLSFGIADRPLSDIPGVMRQDGSPPLYYLALHVWTRVLDVRSEQALHALSLLFALASIPVAWALVRALVSERAGWMAAVLVAFNPFLTQYAQEARMYSLVVLLSLVTCSAFVGAFALERGRRWLAGFAVAQAVLLYTHNWGLFLGLGLAAAWAVLVLLASGTHRRALIRDGLLAAAIICALYAPWLPTLAFQAAHTGAPWANPPPVETLFKAPKVLLGYAGQYLLLVTGGLGLATLMRGPVRRWGPEGRAALALAVATVVTLAVPWLVSQLEPSWAARYLAVAAAPLVMLAAIGLSRARTAGLAALVVVALVWIAYTPPSTKSNVRSVAEAVAPSLAPGDVVISTQPEQAPVLHYYLEDVGPLRWATLTGPLADLGVTDWRDGAKRLRATSVAGDLDPVLAAVRPGQRVALVAPDFSTLARWKAPWSALVRTRSLAWEERMHSDPRFRVVTVEPLIPVARPNEVRATVFVRQRVESLTSTRSAGAEQTPLASALP